MYIRGWGSEKSTIETQGFTLILRGPKYKGSGRRGTMFFDWPPNNEGCYLMTEQLDGDRKTAPFTFSLETTSLANPGLHSLIMYLSYFNGKEWKVSKGGIDIKVRNRYERYQFWLWFVGISVALVGLVLNIGKT